MPSSNTDTLLRAILSVTARQAIPPETLGGLIAPSPTLVKQFRAYNLCDGTRTQAEIAKALQLDSGNLSKTVNRWVESGIVMRISEGREIRLLHIYPFPESMIKKKGEKDEG